MKKRVEAVRSHEKGSGQKYNTEIGISGRQGMKRLILGNRGDQLSHCRTSMRQSLQNMRHTKNLKHCLTGKF